MIRHARKIDPLVWCSLSCLCALCLKQDARLCVITTNGFHAEVRFGR